MPQKCQDPLVSAAMPLIELAIAEDIGPGDATSLSTLPPHAPLRAKMIAKKAGVIAGLPITQAVFARVDETISFHARVADGQEVIAGEVIADITGPGPSLLAAERIALNFLQRLSGIATLTRTFVDAVATTKAIILDTRKTAPGFRALDKYAVRMGGGVNHRMSLFDMILIKDNHVDGAGSLTAAVANARKAYPELPIEVEVRDLDELAQSLAIDPALDRILLDNMTLDMMRTAVQLSGGRVPLEASGGVNLRTVPDIAASGVDFISVGALTHSVQAMDISMDVYTDTSGEPGDPVERVRRIKADLGDRLLILGHHYQRNEIVELADLRGDSLQLSRAAADTSAEFIVFCGVHFMGEVAAILKKPEQHVLLPDMTAGCYLADTATPEAVQEAWASMDTALDGADARVTPVTYVNSSADMKAFCGRHGGIVCTSGNAERVLRWALSQRKRVFFFPDQHLGRNTALRAGIPADKIAVWDPRSADLASSVQQARVILWPGACNVHQRFRPEHVIKWRESDPGIHIVVHPECRADVVALADEIGSTAKIVQILQNAPAGSRWAIGTESRLVHRLQHELPQLIVHSLADVAPFCATMGQVTAGNLAQVVEALAQGRIINEISVEAETAQWARVALERMLAL